MELGWKKTVLYSLLPAIVLFGALELGARVLEIWFPPLAVDYGWGFDPESRVYEADPDQPGIFMTKASKEVSFRPERFPMPKPADEYRIFMVGGSSVNYIQPQLQDMARRLSRAAKDREIRVVDLGGLAYGTHRLVPVVTELVDCQADMLLIYSGHNEFEEADQLDIMDIESLPVQRVVYKSALARFIRDRVAMLRFERLKKDEEKNARILANPEADYMSGFHHQYTPEEMTQRMDDYRRNLAVMIDVCQRKGVDVVIGTVASNLWAPDLPLDEQERKARDFYAAGDYAGGLAYARGILKQSKRHQSSDIENGIIRELATEKRVPLADVERAVATAEPNGVPGETCFSDRCHLNGQGNDILINVFEAKIREILALPPRGSHLLEKIVDKIAN